MRIFQKGFHFAQDGPGNRLVYHLSGCNMHCPWCSNPEGMCAFGGTEVSLLDMVSECERSKPMFFSGGGVTFTGGEATMQAEELMQLLEKLLEKHIHTAIETNGTSKHLLELSEYIDYLIMDFKHFDSRCLQSVTGVGNEQIRKNLAALCDSGRQLHIRIPLIAGFNAENPQGFVDCFRSLRTENVVFEFLPYHEYGKSKWKTEYKVQNGFISEEQLRAFRDMFEAHGLKTVTT